MAALARAGSGTYRAPDGSLVHRWPQPDGAFSLEVDPVDGTLPWDDLRAAELVLLSEDPDWPDLEAYRSVGLGYDET